ncbi:ZZ-type zinc finger-containing protein 3 [Coemansia sp. RSA 2711]|nr:ZZ-type zinc finger-containing protein 3 [Coemansia sp. RSA 2711]
MASEETIAQELEAIAKPPLVDMPSPATETTGNEAACVERNHEYMLVQRAVAALRSQLARATSDIEALERLRSRALARPLEYVEALVRGGAAAAPAQQAVVAVPPINVDAYLGSASAAVAEKYLRLARPRHAGSRGPIGLRVAARSSGPAKGGRRSGQPRLAPLSGVTAVATPEQSPPHGTRQSSVHSGGALGAVSAALPLAARANTEPLHAAPAPAPAARAGTQPGTPTARAGQAQKTLTPQIIAALRQQQGDSSSDDSDFGGPQAAKALGGTAQGAGRRKRGRPRKSEARQTPKLMRRGPTRESTGPKPPSYNQPWSDQEQMRLEQLLLEYPEEEVANARWRKISEALGTRTMRQVASRVQKYFIKLSKAGLPVPGRTPDTSGWTSLHSPPAHAPRRRKPVDFTSSEDEVDVDLDDRSDDEPAAPPVDRKGKQPDLSLDADVVDFGFHIAGTSASAQTPALRSAKAVHLGYRCDACLAEPIVGVRWHCVECRGAQAVDLCDECREEGVFATAWHSDAHTFHAVRDAEMEPYYANEVAAPALREYSYLA